MPLWLYLGDQVLKVVIEGGEKIWGQHFQWLVIVVGGAVDQGTIVEISKCR